MGKCLPRFLLIALSLALSTSVAVAFFGPRQVQAQTASDLSISQSERAQLEKDLADLEAQVAQKQKELAAQQGVSGTLSGDIKILTTKINAKKLEIKAKNLKITQLTASIGEKKTAIISLSQKIENQKDSLAQLLRKTDEMDHATLTNFLLSDSSLSVFYSDVSRFDTLKAQVKAAVDTVQSIKGVTEQKKAQLEKEQNQTIDEKQQLLSIQKSIEQDQAGQKVLLSISQNKESEYKKVIADQQAKVTQIKARLFALAGGGQAIRFDIALQYAQEAQAKTGIDPAFLLAIATQESNLGSNVGACYLTDTSSGAGVNTKTGRTFPNVMKPTRDVGPFLDILSNLGRDMTTTPVSCPIPSAGGWGGAMGPAQFIASTWKLFEPRLESALGVSQANPWLPEHAFMASALYLTDLGAVGTSYSAQIRAACKYYGTGGSTCSYGRSVMNLTSSIQSDIDYLKQYGVSRR